MASGGTRAGQVVLVLATSARHSLSRPDLIFFLPFTADDWSIMLWDVAAGRRLKTFNGHWYAQRGQSAVGLVLVCFSLPSLTSSTFPSCSDVVYSLDFSGGDAILASVRQFRLLMALLHTPFFFFMNSSRPSHCSKHLFRLGWRGLHCKALGLQPVEGSIVGHCRRGQRTG